MMGFSGLLAHFPLLSGLIWVPTLGGAAVLLFRGKAREAQARWMALGIALLTLALCVPLYAGFDTTTAAMQFTETLPWIAAFHVQYHLGVDGISMPLIVLTAFTTLIVVIASWRAVSEKVAQYLAVFLIMQGMVMGVFASLDTLLFYVFWEAMLIPMYLCIGIWGSGGRCFAAIKFFLYTFLGSALLLVALLYLATKAQSFEILDYYPLALTQTEQLWLFGAFLLAFAIKVPMWPVHTWLPDAHTEAPAGGSVILAALMLKVGAYGLLRFSFPITPDASHLLAGAMIVLSLIAVVYIGLVALAQTDMKRLIAYSSVAHMGFVTLGLFIMYGVVAHTGKALDAAMGVEGALVQMISHAFGSGALFLAFGMLYDRMHTREIASFGGVAKTMPVFASFFVVFALTNVGLPGTSGFVGEFLIVLTAFKASPWVTAVAATTVILAAAYTLWMVRSVFYGPVDPNGEVAKLKDVDGVERTSLVLLLVAVFALGIYPQGLLRVMHPTVNHWIQLSLASKLPPAHLPTTVHRSVV